MNIIITLGFPHTHRNGINLLGYVCFRSVEEEGKLATKT